MAMTMTQKILAAAAGLEEVKAGQLIEANLDLVLGNDITSPVAIHEMERVYSIKIKSRLFWIILSRTRISNPQNTANASVNLPVKTA